MLSNKLILIGVLGALVIGLLMLYGRRERQPHRFDRARWRGDDSARSGSASFIITPALLASDGSQRHDDGSHHASSTHQSPASDGGADAGGAGGADGGGGN